MLTRRGVLAAGGALFCALSGCTLNSFNLNLLATGARRETVLNGSLETTAGATKKALDEMKILVESEHDHDKVVLTGATRRGHRFKLTLRQQKSAHLEEVRTTIDMQWVGDPDEQFWLDFLAATSQIQFSRSGVR
jgi:hypothetical protein